MREERVVAQVRKERERIESEKGSGNVDMSSDSAGAGVNTTNTDKSIEALLEQIGHPTSRKRRRTRSGGVRTIALEVPARGWI